MGFQFGKKARAFLAKLLNRKIHCLVIGQPQVSLGINQQVFGFLQVCNGFFYLADSSIVFLKRQPAVIRELILELTERFRKTLNVKILVASFNKLPPENEGSLKIINVYNKMKLLIA